MAKYKYFYCSFKPARKKKKMLKNPRRKKSIEGNAQIESNTLNYRAN